MKSVELENLTSNVEDRKCAIDVNVSPRQRYRLASISRSPPPKTTIAAVLLLFIGFALLVSGLSVYFASHINDRSDKGLSMIILGSMMFVPGMYSSFIILGTWLGWRGYSYNLIASYDE